MTASSCSSDFDLDLLSWMAFMRLFRSCGSWLCCCLETLERSLLSREMSSRLVWETRMLLWWLKFFYSSTAFSSVSFKSLLVEPAPDDATISGKSCSWQGFFLPGFLRVFRKG